MAVAAVVGAGTARAVSSVEPLDRRVRPLGSGGSRPSLVVAVVGVVVGVGTDASSGEKPCWSGVNAGAGTGMGGENSDDCEASPSLNALSSTDTACGGEGGRRAADAVVV